MESRDDTRALLAELTPEKRRLLALYCLRESRRLGRSGLARRRLHGLAVACAALDPLPRFEPLTAVVAELEGKLARLTPAGRTALGAAADNWLLDESPMHLLSMANILAPPAPEPPRASLRGSLAD